MGFTDKIKRIINPDYDDELYEDEEFEEEREDIRSRYRREDTVDAYSEKRNKVVNINSSSKTRVVLEKPESYANVRGLGEHIRNRETMVINLESASSNDKRRILDFVSGATFAIEGNLKHIANSTYLVTPGNVDVMGEMFLGELEDNSL